MCDIKFGSDYILVVEQFGGEWRGTVRNVPQLSEVRGESKDDVVRLLQDRIREYLDKCNEIRIIPQRSCFDRFFTRTSSDELFCEEKVPLAIMHDKGVVFTNVMWLFSKEKYVWDREALFFQYLDPNRVKSGRHLILIDIKGFFGECCVDGQPYPEHFSVEVDNVNKIMKIRFHDKFEEKDVYSFTLNVETSSGSISTAITINRSGCGLNAVYYGCIGYFAKYFFSVNERAFDFFKSIFHIYEIRQKNIEALTICAHAFVNAAVGRAYFKNLGMCEYLDGCLKNAYKYLLKFYIPTKKLQTVDRVWKWFEEEWVKEVSHKQDFLQWFDSETVHDSNYYDSVKRLWELSRGKGNEIDQVITEVVSLRYEGMANADIHKKILEMIKKFTMDGSDVGKKLRFKDGKNAEQKISNFIKGSYVRDFVQENVFPMPLLDRSKKKREDF